MKRNFIIIGIVVVIVLSLVGFFGWQQIRASAATITRVQTVAVQRGSLVATVTAAGNVFTPKNASLSFQKSGKVTQVNVQLGDRVKAGQVLMQLDTTDQLFALKKAQASLASAQASYDNAKAKNGQNGNQLIVAKAALDKALATLQQAQADYNAVAWRNDILSNQKAIALQTATMDYQSALASFNLTTATINDSALMTAQANLDSAKVAVEQAQLELEDTKIIAPFESVAAAVNYNVGDTAGNSTGTSSGMSVGTGQVAVVLADTSVLQVKAMLAEVDVAKVKVGQSAQMILDALPGNTYNAELAAIAPLPTISSGVVNYTIYFNVKNPDNSIKPGMTANMSVIVDQRDNVLLIPTRAVRSQGSDKVVTALYKGQQIGNPINTGLSNDTQIEVIYGLKEGDEVVLPATQTRQPSGFSGHDLVMPGMAH